MIGQFLLALLLVQGQNGQTQGGGSIRGQVIMPSVRASERLQVILQRSDGPIISRAFSDSLGNYEFRNLGPGNYEVIVSIEGYEEVRQQVGVGGGAFSTVTLNIPLTKKEPLTVKKAAAADDLIDVAELGRSYPKKALQEYEKAQDEI